MTAAARQPGRSPRFVPVAVILAGVLVLAAAAMLGLALRDNPRGGFLASMVGGPFQLVDQNGKPFSDADMKGKWNLVFFGFTNCDDTCPTTLNEMSLALGKLAAQERNEVRIVFITVDPWRDTPAVIKSWLDKFTGPIVGLTGSADAVAQAERAYRVYSAKHPLPDGGYDMDHSALIYIMDPQGRFTSTLNVESNAGEMAAQLRKLLAS